MPNPNGGGELKWPLKYLITHAMGEIIDTDGMDYPAHEWLEKTGLSCHYLVTPSGTVIKTREENQIAWHCKAQGCNFNSIGIEILAPGLHNYSTFLQAIKTNYVTDRQYAALVQLTKNILYRHRGITIKRHSDLDPENKFDPGSGFDFGKFLNDVA